MMFATSAFCPSHVASAGSARPAVRSGLPRGPESEPGQRLSLLRRHAFRHLGHLVGQKDPFGLQSSLDQTRLSGEDLKVLGFSVGDRRRLLDAVAREAL